MKVFALVFLILGSSFLALPLLAGSNNYCGKKQTVDGAVVLADDKGKPILELSDRGGDQPLLDQANKILGKRMKDGDAYCLSVMMNAGGNPIRVLKAKPDLLAKEKKTVVVPAGTSKAPDSAVGGTEALPTTDPKASQKIKEVPPTPVDISK